jgi:hypothetical protein
VVELYYPLDLLFGFSSCSAVQETVPTTVLLLNSKKCEANPPVSLLSLSPRRNFLEKFQLVNSSLRTAAGSININFVQGAYRAGV